MDGKGYGFIESDDGTGDIFVHVRALVNATEQDMVIGSKVSYDVGQDERSGKIKAFNVSITRRFDGVPVGMFQQPTMQGHSPQAGSTQGGTFQAGGISVNSFPSGSFQAGGIQGGAIQGASLQGGCPQIGHCQGGSVGGCPQVGNFQGASIQASQLAGAPPSRFMADNAGVPGSCGAVADTAFAGGGFGGNVGDGCSGDPGGESGGGSEGDFGGCSGVDNGGGCEGGCAGACGGSFGGGCIGGFVDFYKGDLGGGFAGDGYFSFAGHCAGKGYKGFSPY